MDTAKLRALYEDHLRTLEAGYAKALAATGFDAVVVHSGSPKKRSEFDDQYFPHRATPEFMHWVPINDRDCAIVVEPGKKTVLVWPEVKDFWERPALPESMHFMHALDVRRAAKPELPTGKKIAHLGEGHDIPPALAKELDALRVRKTPYEIACILEANRRTAIGHEAVRKAFAESDRAELDLHLLYLGATRQDDQDAPYKGIVALGRSASILHHVSYGRDPARAESCLLDAGVTYLGYCSDVTRTWVKPSGAASATFARLLESMEAMQQRLCARITAGAPYEDLHDESHRQVSAILKDAGLATGSVEEIDAKGISRVFYPHGLGHSLGLQTHDVGCRPIEPKPQNPFLRNTTTIDEGQVFTIEPGLYFIDALLAELRSKPEGKLVDWNLVEALAPLGGIRIEDDVHVTESGARNLTREVACPISGPSSGPATRS
jgi:Xaa-Pro dipeptidase